MANEKVTIALVLFTLFIIFSSAAGQHIEISEQLRIEGNGTIDRDFAAQSASDYTGQKLYETILPVYSPHDNYMSSSYLSDFELIMSNNSTIYYESVSDLTNAKHYLENQNYKLGVCTGFYYSGSQNKSFIFESSPSLSEALVISEAEGRSVLRARVVNFSDYHYPTVDMRTWLDGNYTLDWNFLVTNIEYPEAGDGDWLLCPHGVVLP